jgi:hypothetical protein
VQNKKSSKYNYNKPEIILYFSTDLVKNIRFANICLNINRQIFLCHQPEAVLEVIDLKGQNQQ